MGTTFSVFLLEKKETVDICTNVIVFFRRRKRLQTCVLISLFLSNRRKGLQTCVLIAGMCTNVIVFLQEEKDTIHTHLY